MRFFLRLLKYLALALVLYIGGFLLFGTLTEWQPETGARPLGPLSSSGAAETRISDSVVTLTTWNVGYGGIGAETGFFYNDGGFLWTDPGKVRAERDLVDKWTAGQQLLVQSTLSDIFLLQEVDSAARRSYYVDQTDLLGRARPDYAAYFAANYRSRHVPMPVFQPWDHYGAVTSGLVTLSRFRARSAARIQLPGDHPWPTRLFQLDRCLLRQVFATERGPDLVVYNLHLSAYDADGGIRREQIAELRRRCLADYGAGHYVIAGGDWNQLPPGFNWFSLNPTVKEVRLPFAIDFEFMPAGWKYAYDPATPTVRDSAKPYFRDGTRRSVIDFFMLSPNLRIRRVKGINQAFAFSDHQPVYVEVELLGD